MTEGERIIKLETQVDNIEKKVDDGFKTVLDRFDKLDGKYASKWTEDAFRWFLFAVAGVIVVAAATFIIKGGLIK